MIFPSYALIARVVGSHVSLMYANLQIIGISSIVDHLEEKVELKRKWSYVNTPFSTGFPQNLVTRCCRENGKRCRLG